MAYYLTADDEYTAELRRQIASWKSLPSVTFEGESIHPKIIKKV
jgi:hypothetical protein